VIGSLCPRLLDETLREGYQPPAETDVRRALPALRERRDAAMAQLRHGRGDLEPGLAGNPLHPGVSLWAYAAELAADPLGPHRSSPRMRGSG
jgi:hypothetical protein